MNIKTKQKFIYYKLRNIFDIIDLSNIESMNTFLNSTRDNSIYISLKNHTTKGIFNNIINNNNYAYLHNSYDEIDILLSINQEIYLYPSQTTKYETLVELIDSKLNIVQNNNIPIIFNNYNEIRLENSNDNNTGQEDLCEICYTNSTTTNPVECTRCHKTLCTNCYFSTIINSYQQVSTFTNKWICPYCRARSDLVQNQNIKNLIKEKFTISKNEYNDVLKKMTELEEQRASVRNKLSWLEYLDSI
jgi:hypothetical protein